MHTHGIPEGQSMMSMMNNHMDIGIIAKWLSGCSVLDWKIEW
jgi:hypothetical protein